MKRQAPVRLICTDRCVLLWDRLRRSTRRTETRVLCDPVSSLCWSVCQDLLITTAHMRAQFPNMKSEVHTVVRSSLTEDDAGTTLELRIEAAFDGAPSTPHFSHSLGRSDEYRLRAEGTEQLSSQSFCRGVDVAG